MVVARGWREKGTSGADPARLRLASRARVSPVSLLGRLCCPMCSDGASLPRCCSLLLSRKLEAGLRAERRPPGALVQMTCIVGVPGPDLPATDVAHWPLVRSWAAQEHPGLPASGLPAGRSPGSLCRACLFLLPRAKRRARG